MTRNIFRFSCLLDNKNAFSGTRGKIVCQKTFETILAQMIKHADDCRDSKKKCFMVKNVFDDKKCFFGVPNKMFWLSTKQQPFSFSSVPKARKKNLKPLKAREPQCFNFPPTLSEVSCPLPPPTNSFVINHF